MKTQKEIEDKIKDLTINLDELMQWESQVYEKLEKNRLLWDEDALEAEHIDACRAVSTIEKEIKLLKWVIDND